jgi:hypothetical protein
VLNEKGRIEFREGLQEMAKNMLLMNIEVKEEIAYDNERVEETFALTKKTKKFAGVEKMLRIYVCGNELIEKDIKNNIIIFRYPLNSIGYIKVKHKKEYAVLRLYSSHEVRYKLKLNYYEADYLLSSILHGIQVNEGSDSYIPSIFIEPANLSLKVHGHSIDVDSVFEIPLKKELEEALKEKNKLDPKLKELIFDAALNMTFRGIEYDSKFVNTLFDLLAIYTEAIKKIESDPNSYEEYLTYQSNKEVFEIYQGIPPLLTVIRNCLFWRTTLPDTFKTQIEILLALAGSKNSAVSIMASLTLKSVIKVLVRIIK